MAKQTSDELQNHLIALVDAFALTGIEIVHLELGAPLKREYEDGEELDDGEDVQDYRDVAVFVVFGKENVERISNAAEVND